MGVAALPAGARSWAGRRWDGGERWAPETCLSAPGRAPQSAESALCSPWRYVYVSASA